MTDGGSIMVAIPTPMRRFTGGAGKVSVGGSTLAEVLADLGRQHPDLAGRIVEDDGRIRRFVNVFVNGNNVRDLQGEETPVKGGDDVTIIPAMAGGAR
jgi:sulfur-carrier protein